MVGYIVAAPNLKELHERVAVAWLPDLRSKYARVEEGEGGEMLTPCEATINALYSDPDLPPGLEGPESWAVVRLAILPQVTDYSLARRSTMLLLACLRTTGVLKVLAEVPKKEKLVQDLYTRIGEKNLVRWPHWPGIYIFCVKNNISSPPKKKTTTCFRPLRIECVVFCYFIFLFNYPNYG